MKRFLAMVGIAILFFSSIMETQNFEFKVLAQSKKTDRIEQFQGEIVQTDNLMDFSKEVSKLTGNQREVSPEEIPKLDEYFTKRLIVKTKDDLVSFHEYPANTIIKGPDDISVLQFSSISEAKASSELLSKNSKVEYVEPDNLIGIGNNEYEQDSNEKISKSQSSEMEIKSTYKSWGVKRIEADKYAKILSKKKLSSIVAVVDSGVSSHKFLSGKLLKSGYDFVDRDKTPNDENGHGTHVSGTIVDCTPGLNVKIMPIRVLNKNGTGTNIMVANGIKYAADKGANVINLSLGGGHSQSIDNAISYAVKKGVIVVAGAGNESDNVKYFCPAHNSDCITVAAIDSKERKAYFSNYGNAIDVAAPGVDILSCVPGGKYEEANGTSMAAPHISAVAAMIKMSYPSKSPAEVEKTIKEISKDLGTSGWDRYFGYGLPKLTKIINAKTIQLSKNTVFIAKKFKMKLTAKVSPGGFVFWTSSNRNVASVNEDGLITGLKIGKAVITATTVNGLKASCNVSVLSNDVPVVEPKSITLDKSKAALDAGESITLTPTLKPSTTTVKEITFTSSNEKVAEVSEFGLVTAYQTGSTVITAATANGMTATCKITVTGSGIQVTKITLNQKKLQVLMGENVPLWASITPEAATDKRLYISTSNDNIKIDKMGKITAVKEGVTTVRVTTSNSLYEECEVTILDPDKMIKPKEIILDQKTVKVEVGAMAYLSVTIKPDNVTDPTVVFSSNNTLIADVTPQGAIIGKMKGSAVITARTSNGLKAVCTVDVVNPLPTGIILDKSAITIQRGKRCKIETTITPYNASDKWVTWSTSNSEVAYMEYDGWLKADSVGTAVITAKTSNGHTASCTITVEREPILPYRVTVETPKNQIEVGEKITLTATVIPSDADDKSITWSSSDKSVLVVDENGTVTALKKGDAKIIAKTSNGYTYYVYIYVNETEKLPVSILFEQDKLQMTEGESKVLTLLAEPKDVPIKNVNWSSLDSSIVTVDSSGKVKAVKEGSTSITAKLSSGLSAQCQITVKAKAIPVLELIISQKELSIEEGKTAALSVVILPDNASQKEVSWSSSETKVAAVSNNGIVTGYKAGTATITAKSTNGFTASCTVTVTAAKEVIPTHIVLDFSELMMQMGETKKLNATVTPQVAEGKKVSFTSSDLNVAGVSNNGEVTCYGMGSAIITATTENGLSASCTVTGKSAVILPSGISLDKQSIELKTGETNQLSALITPGDAVDQTLVWSSSNPTIVFVDSVGNIMGLSVGSASISVRTINNLETTCIVNVVKPEESLPIMNQTLSLGLSKLYESFIFCTIRFKG